MLKQTKLTWALNGWEWSREGSHLAPRGPCVISLPVGRCSQGWSRTYFRSCCERAGTSFSFMVSRTAACPSASSCTQQHLGEQYMEPRGQCLGGQLAHLRSRASSSRGSVALGRPSSGSWGRPLLGEKNPGCTPAPGREKLPAPRLSWYQSWHVILVAVCVIYHHVDLFCCFCPCVACNVILGWGTWGCLERGALGACLIS